MPLRYRLSACICCVSESKIVHICYFYHTYIIQVSISADAPIEYLEVLALNYLGTVPPRATPRTVVPDSLQLQPLGRQRQLGVFLADSDERAMGYLAGIAPNKWGIFANGTTVSDMLRMRSGKADERRNHPLFGHIACLVLQEVITSFRYKSCIM
jgi:hypothetical protein